MKLAWVTYLGALSSINAILIPRISAHPPIFAQCKVHRPSALFREGTVGYFERMLAPWHHPIDVIIHACAYSIMCMYTV